MSKKRSHKNTTRLTLKERMEVIRKTMGECGYGNLGRALTGQSVGYAYPDFYPDRAATAILRSVRAHVRAALRRKAIRDAR